MAACFEKTSRISDDGHAFSRVTIMPKADMDGHFDGV